ncbi:NAD-dependent DNA ligase LigA [Lachnospiraceae bacterium SGI.054]
MLNRVDRIKELILTLNKASDAYYNSGDPIMTDYEWDNLYDELVKLEEETGVVYPNSPTQQVGYEVKTKLEKVTHSHPMLSLGKTKSVNDLVKFSSGGGCIISLKMDGLTVLNTYEDGNLVQSETRGNGEVGELITHNARVFDNLPVSIDIDKKFEIEGEAIITKDDFDKINSKLKDDEKYKNPRNLASGSVRQLDSKIAKDRHVKFVAWKIPYGFTRFTDGFKFAEELGFDVVPYSKYNSKKDDINVIVEYLKDLADEKGYPIDGLVITYDNVEYGKSLGMTGHHPRHSLAFKFYDEEEVTILKDIEWGIGKTGQLTPVAIFDDVEIDGTTVNRASLHNVSILKELQLGIGDEVTVYKANQIIPQLRENLTKSNTITIPTTCPICGESTKIVKDNYSEVLMCTNDNCAGKLLGKLCHAVSKNALNIEGLSEATIQKFIDLGWLKSIRDIYYLYLHKIDMYKLEGFGRKSVNKLLSSIEDSRNTDLVRYIYAQSIPLIGHTASKAISKMCDGDLNTFIEHMSKGAKAFGKIDGIGSEMIKSIKKWWDINYLEFVDAATVFTFKKKEPVNISGTDLTGKVFVITGSLTQFRNRDEMKERIESLGGKVSGSVSAKTTALINNDIESTSSKNKKAKQLNVPILTENMFMEKYLQ